MKIIRKCQCCGALLSENNTVFVHICRYDEHGRNSKQKWLCCKCWDETQITIENSDPFEPDYKIK